MLYGTLAERSCWLSQNISGPYQPKLFMTFRMLKINVHKAGLDTTDRTDKATGTSVVLRRHTLTRLPRRTFLRGAGILMSGRAASAVGRAQHQGGSACVGQRPMRARNGLMSLPVLSGYMQTSLKEMPFDGSRLFGGKTVSVLEQFIDGSSTIIGLNDTSKAIAPTCARNLEANSGGRLTGHQPSCPVMQ